MFPGVALAFGSMINLLAHPVNKIKLKIFHLCIFNSFGDLQASHAPCLETVGGTIVAIATGCASNHAALIHDCFGVASRPRTRAGKHNVESNQFFHVMSFQNGTSSSGISRLRLGLGSAARGFSLSYGSLM